MQNVECRMQNVWNPMVPDSFGFFTVHSSFESGASGETRSFVEWFARRCTKLLLSLLSHVGLLNAECRMQNEECRITRPGPSIPHSSFSTLHSSFFIQRWWVATVLPRALRFKRPLHRCNACDPIRDAKAESNHRSQACVVLAGTGISRRGKMVRAAGDAPAFSCSRSKRLTFRLRSDFRKTSLLILHSAFCILHSAFCI